MRGELNAALEALDVSISEFLTAAECLNSPEIDRFHCIISEVALPDMSGLELLRKLRACAGQLPIILYAREADVPTAVAAMREGATDFIEKPAIALTVLRRVAQLLRHEY